MSSRLSSRAPSAPRAALLGGGSLPTLVKVRPAPPASKCGSAPVHTPWPHRPRVVHQCTLTDTHLPVHAYRCTLTGARVPVHTYRCTLTGAHLPVHTYRCARPHTSSTVPAQCPHSSRTAPSPLYLTAPSHACSSVSAEPAHAQPQRATHRRGGPFEKHGPSAQEAPGGKCCERMSDNSRECCSKHRSREWDLHACSWPVTCLTESRLGRNRPCI